jgi:phosphoglycerate dehydrogenase-like enzyme
MRKLICVAALTCASALFAQGPKKVVVIGIPPAEVQELQTAVSTVRLVPASGAAVLREIADADAVLGTVSPEQFRAAKKLKWMHVHSAGV